MAVSSTQTSCSSVYSVTSTLVQISFPISSSVQSTSVVASSTPISSFNAQASSTPTSSSSVQFSAPRAAPLVRSLRAPQLALLASRYQAARRCKLQALYSFPVREFTPKASMHPARLPSTAAFLPRFLAVRYGLPVPSLKSTISLPLICMHIS
jgi:hypothetical protein